MRTKLVTNCDVLLLDEPLSEMDHTDVWFGHAQPDAATMLCGVFEL
jgi:hypothetical protein